MRAALALAVLLSGCARTSLYGFADADDDDRGGGGGGIAGSGGAPGGSGGSAGMVVHECDSSSDCPVTDLCVPPVCRIEGDGASARRRCLAEPLDCDDGDPCTVDRCDPLRGSCEHSVLEDLDGDGFIGAPPPGSPPGCGGPDCDDEDPTVNPLGVELCDGRDNDCSGGIDDGHEYQLASAPVLVSSRDIERAQRGGLAWSGEAFGLTYASAGGRRLSYFKLLGDAGDPLGDDVLVSQINADTYAGPLAFSGTDFLTVWSDARQAGNYEVYATRFASDGQKLQADLRLTDAPDFSIKPAVVWTGTEYVVAWSDWRDDDDGGLPQVYGRRFTSAGTPIGDEVALTPRGLHAEYPALAVGGGRLGLAYVVVAADGTPTASFRSLDPSLTAGGEPVELPLSSFVDDPSITFLDDRFLIAWHEALPDLTPGPTLHAATVDLGGNVAGGHPVAFGFSFVRGHTLVSLGDRAFVVYAGAGPGGDYDLWAMTIGADLRPLPGERLTSTAAKSIQPLAALGRDGRIGVVFDEDNDRPPTSRRVHFLSVDCLPVR